MTEPSTDDFRQLLEKFFATAEELGFVAVDVNSGNLHRFIGVYPSPNHRMPACCGAMRNAMQPGDSIVEEPPKGSGANLTIRYQLPRPK